MLSFYVFIATFAALIHINNELATMLILKYLNTLGRYILLMGRSFARPERMRMFLKQYIKEMSALGVDSIGIVLLISFFIGAVICIQMKLNIQSPWMPRWVSGYTTREILLLEFSSSIMCLILAGKVGSNIASELGTMRVTQQIDALEIMGVNSANYLILPKILGFGYADAVPRHLLLGYGYSRSLRHGVHRTHPLARRPDTGLATLVQCVVHVDEYHQESCLRVYHRERVELLRLHRRGRLGGGWQGEHRRRCLLKCTDFVLRRVPHSAAQLTNLNISTLQHLNTI